MWTRNRLTYAFRQRTEDQSNEVCPCFISYAESELNTQARSKDGQEKGIGAKIRIITVDGELDGAVDADVGAIIR